MIWDFQLGIASPTSSQENMWPPNLLEEWCFRKPSKKLRQATSRSRSQQRETKPTELKFSRASPLTLKQQEMEHLLEPHNSRQLELLTKRTPFPQRLGHPEFRMSSCRNRQKQVLILFKLSARIRNEARCSSHQCTSNTEPNNNIAATQRTWARGHSSEFMSQRAQTAHRDLNPLSSSRRLQVRIKSWRSIFKPCCQGHRWVLDLVFTNTKFQRAPSSTGIARKGLWRTVTLSGRYLRPPSLQMLERQKRAQASEQVHLDWAEKHQANRHNLDGFQVWIAQILPWEAQQVQ